MSSLVLTPITELPTDLKSDVFALEQAGRTEGAFSIEAAARLSIDAELQHLDSIYHSDLAASINAVPDRVSVRPAAQWATWLSSNAAKLGVRQEEIEWSGIGDYLATLGAQRVSRAQLLSYLAESGIKLGEVEKGRELVLAMQDEAAKREYGKSFDELGARAAQHVSSLVDAMPLASQYDAFVLPGGENYRELLITLRDASATKGGIGKHVGTHWAEKNVIAHVRFDERTNVDGEKVLFLHEIQSDWAQDGRQKGFESARQGMTPQELAAIIGHYDELLREMPKIFFPLTDVAEMMRAMGTMEISKALIAAGLPDSSIALHPNSNSIPDGPFVTRTEAWVGLAIKRMLKYAVDHGFERVALISGQQSADRFDLSTTVTAVRATRTFLGHYQLEVRAKDGKVVVDDVVVPERLRTIVGRELAARIEEGGDKQHYRGLNIPVGGEGMKAFYDEIVPQVAKQVLRKFGGGELGEVVIAEENGGKYVLRKPDGTYVRDEAGIYPYSSKRAAQNKAAQFARNGEKGFVVEPAPMAGGQQLCIHIDDALRASLQGSLPMFSRDAAQARKLEPAPEFAQPDTGSPEFASWFGDSVMRMSDGSPIPLYHGTTADFSEFKSSASGSYGAGVYLTPDAGAAELFGHGDDGNVIIPVFVRLERPYFYDVSDDDLDGLPAYRMLYDVLPEDEADAIVAEDSYDIDHRITEALQDLGHDGVIVTFSDGGKEYLVFSPDQVKSALTNTGDFDPDNADIRFSRQRHMSALESFMAGSKVVVENGEPLVVYHGTRSKGSAIDSFELSRAGKQTDSGWMGQGFYFGSKATADAYAGHHEFDPEHFPEGGAVYPVYLSLKNPAILYDGERNDGPRTMVRELLDLPDEASAEEVRKGLVEAGYDGVIYERFSPYGKGYTEYVAFHPEQIKSATGNIGNFDPKHSDIRFQRVGAGAPLNPADSTAMFNPATVDGLRATRFKSREKMINMPIADFLRLAEAGGGEFKANRVAEALKESGYFNDVAYLKIEREGVLARVYGHEGRHRARALQARGYTHMPVVLSSSDIRWSEQASGNQYDYIATWPTSLVGQNGDVLPFPVSRESAGKPFSIEPEPARAVKPPHFADWFDGSLVVGNDGQALPVYHGTIARENFAEFRCADSFGGGMFGKGVHFTSSAADAAKYASTDVGINHDLGPKAEKLAASLARENGGDRFRGHYMAIRNQMQEGLGRIIPAYLAIRKPLVIGAPKIAIPEHYFMLACAESDIPKDAAKALFAKFSAAKDGVEQFHRVQDAKATMLYRQAATMMGFDGLIIHPEVAPKSNGATHYMVLNPNQIMSAIDYGVMDCENVLAHKNGAINGCAVYADGVASVGSFGVGKDASESLGEKESIQGLPGAENILSGKNDPTNGSRRASPRAPVKSARRISDQELDAVRALAAAFDSEVVVFRQSATSKLRFNGAKHGKNIWLNEQSSQPLHTVFGHELLHMMKSDRPDLYKSLYEALSGLLRDDAVYAEQAGLAGHGTDYVHEEMIADLLGDQFAERGFWDQVASRSGTAFTGIVSFVSGAIDKVRNSVFGADRPLSSGADRFVRDLDQARVALAGAVAEYLADKRAGFFEGVKASAARMLPVGVGAGFDRMEVAAALLENIDDDVSAVYAEAVGGKVTYGAVFNWLDGPALANLAAPHVGQLLEIAKQRGVEIDQRVAGNVIQKRFDEAMRVARGAEKGVSGVEMGIDARI